MNASGRFNVPFGKYAKPKILDVGVLRAAHDALAVATVRLADFADVTSELAAGDFAYFDPPYVPVSKTAHVWTTISRGSLVLLESRLKPSWSMQPGVLRLEDHF